MKALAFEIAKMAGLLLAFFGPNGVIYYYALGTLPKQVVIMTTVVELLGAAALAWYTRKPPNTSTTVSTTTSTSRALTPLQSLLYGLAWITFIGISILIPPAHKALFDEPLFVSMACPLTGYYCVVLYASILYYTGVKREWHQERHIS